MLSGADIASLLPHAGAMVLLDRVEHWSATDIVCATQSHRRADNPLRRDGQLAAVCAVEYGAQAMALHAALRAREAAPDRPGRRGFLASVRDVKLHQARLDEIAGDLTIRAQILLPANDRFIYGFTVKAGGVEVVTGQAAVVLA
ncbi:MAG: 3-hydroxylacyl-ACP dehydratase [Alphaproteobacteria bacterium]